MKRTPYAHIFILIAFLINTLGPIPTTAQAQDFRLPAPGVMVHLSPEFNPPILKGIKVHSDNPFRFEFILDKGDSRLSNDALKDESSKLIKYFLASLTIPEKDLWVNLSPYEKDRIIPQSFGLTEMGRDLLAEDYMLKQITASLIYPEGETGKKFWKRIYEEAAKKFGTTNIPVNTFNKVWIIPEKAVVYENAKAGTAYVVESKLKVMLEQDYLALSKSASLRGSEAAAAIPERTTDNDVNALGSQIVREIVIPELTKEVNENKNFARLRQVYNSLILATWYKKKIKNSILEQVYADKNKVAGVNIDDPQEKEKIYHQYLKAFKKGVFNYIKEDIDSVTHEEIPKKYFSGGFDAESISPLLEKAPASWKPKSSDADNAEIVTTDCAMAQPVTRRFFLKAGVAALAVGTIQHKQVEKAAIEMADAYVTHVAKKGSNVTFEDRIIVNGRELKILFYNKNNFLPGRSVYTATLNLNTARFLKTEDGIDLVNSLARHELTHAYAHMYWVDNKELFNKYINESGIPIDVNLNPYEAWRVRDEVRSDLVEVETDKTSSNVLEGLIGQQVQISPADGWSPDGQVYQVSAQIIVEHILAKFNFDLYWKKALEEREQLGLSIKDEDADQVRKLRVAKQIEFISTLESADKRKAAHELRVDLYGPQEIPEEIMNYVMPPQVESYLKKDHAMGIETEIDAAKKTDRRKFLQNLGLSIAGLAISGTTAVARKLKADKQEVKPWPESPEFESLDHELGEPANKWTKGPHAPSIDIYGPLEGVGKDFFPARWINNVVRAIYVLPPDKLHEIYKEDGYIEIETFKGIVFPEGSNWDPANKDGNWEPVPNDSSHKLLRLKNGFSPDIVSGIDSQDIDYDKFYYFDKDRMDKIVKDSKKVIDGAYIENSRSVILRLENRDRNKFILVHEIGHGFWEYVLDENTRNSLQNIYKDNMGIFEEVSKYAYDSESAQEAFCEMFRMWVEEPAKFNQFYKIPALRPFVEQVIKAFSWRNKEDGVTVRLYQARDSSSFRDINFSNGYSVVDVITNLSILKKSRFKNGKDIQIANKDRAMQTINRRDALKRIVAAAVVGAATPDILFAEKTKSKESPQEVFKEIDSVLAGLGFEEPEMRKDLEDLFVGDRKGREDALGRLLAVSSKDSESKKAIALVIMDVFNNEKEGIYLSQARKLFLSLKYVPEKDKYIDDIKVVQSFFASFKSNPFSHESDNVGLEEGKKILIDWVNEARTDGVFDVLTDYWISFGDSDQNLLARLLTEGIKPVLSLNVRDKWIQAIQNRLKRKDINNFNAFRLLRMLYVDRPDILKSMISGAIEGKQEKIFFDAFFNSGLLTLQKDNGIGYEHNRESLVVLAKNLFQSELISSQEGSIENQVWFKVLNGEEVKASTFLTIHYLAALVIAQDKMRKNFGESGVNISNMQMKELSIKILSRSSVSELDDASGELEFGTGILKIIKNPIFLDFYFILFHELFHNFHELWGENFGIDLFSDKSLTERGTFDAKGLMTLLEIGEWLADIMAMNVTLQLGLEAEQPKKVAGDIKISNMKVRHEILKGLFENFPPPKVRPLYLKELGVYLGEGVFGLFRNINFLAFPGRVQEQHIVARLFEKGIIDDPKANERLPQIISEAYALIGHEAVRIKETKNDKELWRLSWKKFQQGIRKVWADHAMLTPMKSVVSKTGGIDLTPANMNLQTQNAGEGIKFHLDPAMLQQLQNAPGFVPVIISVQPLKSLSEFLGLNQD